MTSELNSLLEGFQKLVVSEKSEMSVTPDQLKAIVESAVCSALVVQERQFEKKLEELKLTVNSLNVSAPEVETYTEAQIRENVVCKETLDIAKSLPDFEGKLETYVSWRKAAHTAYKVYEKYEGSSTHYQALGIIRNKIRGPADNVLASFDTPLNFKAIINRLDFTYADKRPIYLIEQELSTLRQGNRTLLQFYEEVEKKLTLLTNKTIMTYDNVLAASLNEKYRTDALRVFVSGTKKSLSDILFSAKPKDLPSALALAQEVESNHERYAFATTYARNIEDKAQQGLHIKNKNPYFSWRTANRNQQEQQVEPMDIDSSSRFRQPKQFNNQWRNQPQNKINPVMKRPNSGTARFTGPKQQRINHLTQSGNSYDQQEVNYRTEADTEVENIDNEFLEFDQINFLGITPCFRSLKEQ